MNLEQQLEKLYDWAIRDSLENFFEEKKIKWYFKENIWTYQYFFSEKVLINWISYEFFEEIWWWEWSMWDLHQVIYKVVIEDNESKLQTNENWKIKDLWFKNWDEFYMRIIWNYNSWSWTNFSDIDFVEKIEEEWYIYSESRISFTF